MARNYEELRLMLHTTMIDQPRGMNLDQQLLPELRTSQADLEQEIASVEATA